MLRAIAFGPFLKVLWRSRRGRQHVIFAAATPSDHRAARNAKSLVRRQARKVGL
jgi:hypothetical protein